MNLLNPNRKRYYAVFLIREQNTYSVIKRKKFNPENKTIRFKKGNAQVIDVSIPTYSKGLNLYYFIDINEGQIEFSDHKGDKTKHKINPALIDMIVHQSTIKQLTANLSQKFMGGQIVNILGALVMGGLIGFIIGAFVV